MRSFCLFAILFAFFAPVKLHASEQYQDILIYNGKEYELGFDVDILQLYLEKENKWKWRNYLSLQSYWERVNKWKLQKYLHFYDDWYWCSALLRGYYATFEIVNNELALKDIGICDGSILEGFPFIFKAKGSRFKLDWFTDSLVIGEGKRLYDLHEYYSILHFEKGMLIKKTRIGYKEYIGSSLERPVYYWGGLEKDLEKLEHYLETEKEDKSEFLSRLKIEYEKKFGEPISDYELKIQKIDVLDKYEFQITRTLYGARARYDIRNSSGQFEEAIEVRLSIEEWLDFIRALSACGLDKWEKMPSVPYHYEVKKGTFFVDFSSKGKARTDRYVFPVAGTEKVMEDMVEKIMKYSTIPLRKYFPFNAFY